MQHTGGIISNYLPNGYTVNAFVLSQVLFFGQGLFQHVCNRVLSNEKGKCQCTFSIVPWAESNWFERQRFKAL